MLTYLLSCYRQNGSILFSYPEEESHITEPLTNLTQLLPE